MVPPCCGGAGLDVSLERRKTSTRSPVPLSSPPPPPPEVCLSLDLAAAAEDDRPSSAPELALLHHPSGLELLFEPPENPLASGEFKPVSEKPCEG